MTRDVRTAPAPDAEPEATVAALAAAGAEAAHPVRFAALSALARHAADRPGPDGDAVRRRLAALVAAWPAAAAVPDDPPSVDRPPDRPSTGSAEPTPRAALAALVDRLGRPAGPTPSAPTERIRHAEPAPLKSVEAFHGTWAQLRVAQRLRQALAHVPQSAGPLHTAHVVNRALQAMQALSPAYLDAFMAHVDTLQWLGQAGGAVERAPRPAPASEPRRPAPRAPRPPRKTGRTGA